MAKEIEVKFLNIDKDSLEKKLVEISAVQKGEKLFRSTSFDYPGFPMDKECAWVRLRDEGDRTTLAYKKRLGVTSETLGNDLGMEEIEFNVGDFEKTRDFLYKIGMIEKFSQEKIRISWLKEYGCENVAFDIDIWPRLDPFLEIEAESFETIDLAIKDLGLDPANKKICSATQIYKMVGIDDKDYIKMTFKEWVKRDK